MVTVSTCSSGWTPVKRYQTTKHGCKAGSRRAACTTDRLTDTEVMSGETKPAWHSARSCLKRLNGWVTNCLSQSVSWSQRRKTTSDQMSQNRILKLGKSAWHREPAPWGRRPELQRQRMCAVANADICCLTGPTWQFLPCGVWLQ